MNTYKNDSPFPVILDLKGGRKILKPKEEFKTEEEVNVPGITRVGFVKEEALKEFPSKPAPNKQVPVETLLQTLFNSRFGSK